MIKYAMISCNYEPFLWRSKVLTYKRMILSGLLTALVFSLASVASAASFHEMHTGAAQFIAAGDGTSPWVIGTNKIGTDYGIWYLDGSTWLQTMTGAASEISAAYDSAGMNYPVVVNAAGTAYFGVPHGSDIGAPGGIVITWNALPGEKVHSAAGGTCTADGTCSVFTLGTTLADGGDVQPGGYGPITLYEGSITDSNFGFDWTRGTPSSFCCGGFEISTFSNPSSATPTYVVDTITSQATSFLWELNPTSGQGQPTWLSSLNGASWVTVGPSSVWVVLDGVLNELSGGNFNPVSGTPPTGTILQASVGANGTVWVVDENYKIWYYN